MNQVEGRQRMTLEPKPQTAAFSSLWCALCAMLSMPCSLCCEAMGGHESDAIGGHESEATGGHSGWPRETTGDNGRPRETTGGHGSQREAMGGHSGWHTGTPGDNGPVHLVAYFDLNLLFSQTYIRDPSMGRSFILRVLLRPVQFCVFS